LFVHQQNRFTRDNFGHHFLNAQEPWGGGVSIENPHVQRVEYCRLLEAEYMQRLPAGKGHAVERDVQVSRV
jgi:hypothetical protein